MPIDIDPVLKKNNTRILKQQKQKRRLAKYVNKQHIK